MEHSHSVKNRLVFLPLMRNLSGHGYYKTSRSHRQTIRQCIVCYNQQFDCGLFTWEIIYRQICANNLSWRADLIARPPLLVPNIRWRPASISSLNEPEDHEKFQSPNNLASITVSKGVLNAQNTQQAIWAYKSSQKLLNTSHNQPEEKYLEAKILAAYGVIDVLWQRPL